MPLGKEESRKYIDRFVQERGTVSFTELEELYGKGVVSIDAVKQEVHFRRSLGVVRVDINKETVTANWPK